MRLVGVLVCVALAGCAAAKDGLEEIDAGIDAPLDGSSGGFPDGGPRSDAMIRYDAGILSGFNGPCHDRNGCESGLCILAPTGGYCTMMCTAGGCPEGFGCFNIGGLDEPGEFLSVCAKSTDLLCSPCATSAECSSFAADLCLEAPTGGKFCARDCRMEACPMGYDCQTVPTGDAGVARQCMPASGVCDCQMGDTGETKGCPIPTPLDTVCDGVRTCLGSAGWSECQPPSQTDVPDGDYGDENCDGIDGDSDDGVFVATPAQGGDDGADCAASDNPCATVSNGARRAKLIGRHFVFVQAGTYDETVVLRDGVSIYGGYDTSWKRAARSTVGHEVRIVGQLSPADNQVIAVVAHDLTSPTTISDLTIVGGQAVGSANGSGRSSYGIHAAAAQLIVDRVTINAGKGAPGQRGSDGLAAPKVTAEQQMVGKKGDNGDEGPSACNDGDFGDGGLAGQNACGAYTTGDPTPGRGGDGGPKDTHCDVGCIFGDCTAVAGHTGDPAVVWWPGFYGFGGPGGTGGEACGLPGQGATGRVVNGAGGAGGAGGGRIVARYWYAFAGDDGKLGLHGGGGGGGGGSGGCDIGTDSYGAGGGGGGAGGCAARGGGGRGEGGGGSFGVFAVEGSAITLRFVTIEQANGGRGGDGGSGGQGQGGGGGGPGGLHDGDEKDGARGGDGGQGGHGGGGGGGAGGVSHGVYLQSSSLDSDESNIINDDGATGGDGGAGGGAPVAPTRGNDGLGGPPGATGTIYTCANPDRC